jgi:hypothetical protein
MAFGQKAPEKPKAPTFYLKPSKANDGTFAGPIGEDNALYKITGTGKHILEINGGKDKGGTEYWGKDKEGQYGPYILFVIEGHFWYGKIMETKYGLSFQLKQGAKAEDSAEWKAKKAAAATTDAAPFEGGAGVAGLSAPAGQAAGVTIKAGSDAGLAGVKPPKPSNYKRN